MTPQPPTQEQFALVESLAAMYEALAKERFSAVDADCERERASALRAVLAQAEGRK